MTHKIPEPFCWDESFRVFYQDIDDEHKVLFQGVFDCCEDRGNQGKFDALYTNVDNHFLNEEGKFSKYKYEHEKAHKAAHDEFRGKLKGLSLPLSDDSVNYAKNWLVQHIKTIDFKYKGKLE